MDFLFGPVPSRRLGLSLGINIVPYKTCSYNCIYCEVGKTTKLSAKRERFFDPLLIEAEFEKNIDKVGRVDFVTFSGSGEPTLNKDIGRLIRFVKKKGYPVAVLTNGSLMFMDEVREELALADVVVPSLDTAVYRSFLKLNRPHPSLDLETIIAGIARFSHSFLGQLWLEVLFVKGINDSKEELDALIKAINYIQPTKTQIGTVDRPPALPWVEKLSDDEMMDIYLYLSAKLSVEVELIGNFNKENDRFYEDIENSIVKLINIRPCSKEELARIFSIDEEKVELIVEAFIKEGKAFEYEYGGKLFITGSMARIAHLGV